MRRGFTGERAPHCSDGTQLRKQKPLDAGQSAGRSQQHLSSSPSYRKYNTIFYKRTKRTERLLSYKEQAEYVQRTAGTRTRGSQTLWIRSGDVETELATDSESIFTTTSKNLSAPGPPYD